MEGHRALSRQTIIGHPVPPHKCSVHAPICARSVCSRTHASVGQHGPRVLGLPRATYSDKLRPPNRHTALDADTGICGVSQCVGEEAYALDEPVLETVEARHMLRSHMQPRFTSTRRTCMPDSTEGFGHMGSNNGGKHILGNQTHVSPAPCTEICTKGT